MEEVPISLYIRLEQGQRADLATVSRSAIAFIEVIEEMAAVLFPDAEVRVEAIDAVQASFGWNTVTKLYAKAQAGIFAGAAKYPKAAYLAAYVALRILNNGVDWTQEKVMDWLAGTDAPGEVRKLAPDERRALAEDIAAELNKGVATRPTDKLYVELRRDPKVEGVGVTVRPNTRPTIIVPRAAFIVSREGPNIDGERRTYRRNVEVTLISPVLAPGERRWKFRSATGEFGAPVKDATFLAEVLSGRTDLRLKAGVVLDIELEVSEVRDDGVWTIENRSVTAVRGWRNAPEQGELLPPGPGDVQESEKADENRD